MTPPLQHQSAHNTPTSNDHSPAPPAADLAGALSLALTLAADLPVYFAHAHSPWERGTNENTNGLIREYFPKGTEITGDMNYLWMVSDSLNDRPRAILGFRKPSEVFAELMLQEAVIPPA